MTILLVGALVLIALSSVACIAGQPIDLDLVEREERRERGEDCDA